MEAKKIAIACFVGGALCVVVALMCAPMSPIFWCLGLLAGFAGGYLGYEFREMLRAIPIAWRKSHRGVSTWWTETDEEVREYFKKPHPEGYCFFVILFITTLGLLITEGVKISPDLQFTPLHIFVSFTLSLFLLFYCSLAALIPFLLIILFNLIGFKSRKETLTVRDLLIDAMRGIVLSIRFVALALGWKVWKYLAIGIWLLLCLLKRFGWEFFKLIHSKERVLCAIDGTIGGAIAFFCFASTSLTFPQQILVVFFGGLLGAVIGVLNYEIISKRVLHLVPAINNT